MAEVARVWSGILNDVRAFTLKDASQAEIEPRTAHTQPKSGLEAEVSCQEYGEQIVCITHEHAI
jgi:hypothetical protein